MQDEWQTLLTSRDHLSFSPFSEGSSVASISLSLKPAMRFTQAQADNTPFDQLRAVLDHSPKQVMLACFSTGSCDRLQTLLSERGFHTLRIDDWRAHKNIKGKTVGFGDNASTSSHLIPRAYLARNGLIGETDYKVVHLGSKFATQNIGAIKFELRENFAVRLDDAPEIE